MATTQSGQHEAVAPETAPAQTPPAPPAPAGWTVEQSKALYNIDGWGAGFFDVNAQGHVVVRPDAEHPQHELDLYELYDDYVDATTLHHHRERQTPCPPPTKN